MDETRSATFSDVAIRWIGKNGRRAGEGDSTRQGDVIVGLSS